MLHPTQFTENPLENKLHTETPKGAEKQLDYILVNRKYLRCSNYPEGNDVIHMGTDHRSVMAQFVIPASTRREILPE